MKPDTTMRWAEREFELHRLPLDSGLRAWDAADLYALDQLAKEGLAPEACVLLVEDIFGALACALGSHSRTVWCDSHLGHLALRSNESRNAIEVPAHFVPSELVPEGPFDAVVVKVPREKNLLDHYLSRLLPSLAPNAKVIGAGMTRLVHSSTVSAFEARVGETTTTRARQKARLLLSRPNASPSEPTGPALGRHDASGIEFVAYPGVFSQRGVDSGTDLLLAHLPRPAAGARVVDLGCGSGLLAAALARRAPTAEVLGLDQSHLAVLSARETFARNGLHNASAEVADGLSEVASASLDLVVSNPPQHQRAAASQEMMARLLVDLPRVLRSGGEARLVANRHVNLNVALVELFHEVRILAQDRRFMVCRAWRPRGG